MKQSHFVIFVQIAITLVVCHDNRTKKPLRHKIKGPPPPGHPASSASSHLITNLPNICTTKRRGTFKQDCNYCFCSKEKELFCTLRNCDRPKEKPKIDQRCGNVKRHKKHFKDECGHDCFCRKRRAFCEAGKICERQNTGITLPECPVVDPCMNVQCPVNFVCNAVLIANLSGKCPWAVCQSLQPALTCVGMPCDFGLVCRMKKPDGCEECEPKPKCVPQEVTDPCENVDCGGDFVCEAVPISKYCMDDCPLKAQCQRPYNPTMTCTNTLCAQGTVCEMSEPDGCKGCEPKPVCVQQNDPGGVCVGRKPGYIFKHFCNWCWCRPDSSVECTDRTCHKGPLQDQPGRLERTALQERADSRQDSMEDLWKTFIQEMWWLESRRLFD